MKTETMLLSFFLLVALIHPCLSQNEPFEESRRFNIETDLLLLNYDCKTDVDDLHSVAGWVTLSSDPKYSKVKFHAVAGTYGTQEGLYVPPNTLFRLAFSNNWTDAHADFDKALDKVLLIVKTTLDAGGNVWIAEAGQSDFSAELVKRIQSVLPEINTRDRIHVVQHSDWNEEVTSLDRLDFIRRHTSYHKIPDGNAVGNGTPGFKTSDYDFNPKDLTNPKVRKVWKKAIELANTYNASDGRYNNEAVAAGGLDFSDLSEVCWILELEEIKDTEEFFERFGN